jgi:aldehyde dehydrogenase (NAD+)
MIRGMTGMPTNKVGAGSATGNAEILQTYERVRRGFDSGRTRPIEWRYQQLDAFARMLREHEAAMSEALKADLGKPAFEGWIGEINFVASDLQYIRKHLRSWMKPKRTSAPIALQPARARVHAEPLGTVLIIAPWNYPIQLALAPLAGALAAGNSAVLKPSEVAPASSALLAKLIP